MRYSAPPRWNARRAAPSPPATPAARSRRHAAPLRQAPGSPLGYNQVRAISGAEPVIAAKPKQSRLGEPRSDAAPSGLTGGPQAAPAINERIEFASNSTSSSRLL